MFIWCGQKVKMCSVELVYFFPNIKVSEKDFLVTLFFARIMSQQKEKLPNLAHRKRTRHER